MAGKSNKEKATELHRQGMSMKEISKTLGISYNTVYYWFRRSRGKNTTGKNGDRHLCRTCQYRASGLDNVNHGINCNYIEIMHHSRGCSAGECTAYVKGKRLTSQRKFVVIGKEKKR